MKRRGLRLALISAQFCRAQTELPSNVGKQHSEVLRLGDLKILLRPCRCCLKRVWWTGATSYSVNPRLRVASKKRQRRSIASRASHSFPIAAADRQVRPTSFQCAARGLDAARATRRGRCRDRWSILKERTAAGVTPSRERISEARSAGLGTAACQHHWRVRRRRFCRGCPTRRSAPVSATPTTQHLLWLHRR